MTQDDFLLPVAELELPRINESYLARQYRYCYGASNEDKFPSLVKDDCDVSTKRAAFIEYC